MVVGNPSQTALLARFFTYVVIKGTKFPSFCL